MQITLTNGQEIAAEGRTLYRSRYMLEIIVNRFSLRHIENPEITFVNVEVNERLWWTPKENLRQNTTFQMK